MRWADAELKQQPFQAPTFKSTKAIYASKKHKNNHIRLKNGNPHTRLSAATRIPEAPRSFPFPNHVKLRFQAHPALAGPSILPPHLQLSLTCSHKPFSRASSEGFGPDGTQTRFLLPWGGSWWRGRSRRQGCSAPLRPAGAAGELP